MPNELEEPADLPPEKTPARCGVAATTPAPLTGTSRAGAAARSPAAGRWLSPSPPGSSPAPLPRQEEGSRVARGKGRLSSALHSCSDPRCPAGTSGPARQGCGCAGGGLPAPGEGPGEGPGICTRLGTQAAPGPSCSSTSVQIAVVSPVLARLCCL